jgi:hypothetical protein
MVWVNYGNRHCFHLITSITISISWIGISVGNRMDVEYRVIPFVDTGEFAQIYHVAKTVR